MGNVARRNKSCYKYECVMSCLKSCYKYEKYDMTHSYKKTWHDAFIFITRLFCTRHVTRTERGNCNCDCSWIIMSHVYVHHDMSHIRLPHSERWMSHVTYMNESCHIHEAAHESWCIYMSHVAHTNDSCRTYKWVMSQIQMSHVTLIQRGHHNCCCP